MQHPMQHQSRILSLAFVLAFTTSLIACTDKGAAETPDEGQSETDEKTMGKPTNDSLVEEAPSSEGPRWFRALRGVTPIAVIAFEPGKVGTVEIVGTGEKADALREMLPTLGAADGFSEKMHVGGKNGERGGLSLVHFPPTSAKYVDVFLSKVKGNELNIEEVRSNSAPPIAGVVSKLTISKTDTELGTIDFTSNPPALTLSKGNDLSQNRRLEIYWRQALEMKELQIWYTKTKEGKLVLESRKAAQGDPAYGDIVRIWLHQVVTVRDKQYFEVSAETK